MPQIRDTSKFFEYDLPSYAAYDNSRKIASASDGLKLSMRKIIFTLIEKYPGRDKTKTDTVANIAAAYTNYLHGANNLCGVIDTMTQSFVGANNFPLLEGNSSGFGTRINPQCSAARYTKIALSPLVEELLNKDDIEIAGRQFFEGSYIEPKYFVPTFPILFLNGSHGLSTGFSQDIYPRNPQEVIAYIKNTLNSGGKTYQLLPWFKGYTGKIELSADTNKVVCYGVIVKNSMTSYTITEIPIGMEYQKYIEVLEKLCDDNVIVDYEDNCDTKTDTISFNIKTTREFTKKYDTDAKLYAVLKLARNLSETLCCIDSNNKVKEYTSVKEILDDFIETRLNFYKLRKQYVISQLEEKLKVLNSKHFFCDSVIKNTIVINNVKKDTIIQEFEKHPEIVKVDDSFNYLLNMPIHSVTYETLTALEKDIKTNQIKLNKLKSTSIKQMWLDDLEKIQPLLTV